MQILRFTALEIDIIIFRTAAGYGIGMRIASMSIKLFKNS